MGYTITFLYVFKEAVTMTLPLLIALALMVTILGQVVAVLEKWEKFDAFYWSFITATTVGFGDIRPSRRPSRMLAILIAFVGIMFTGIIVSITVEAASVAFNKHVDPAVLEQLKENLQ